MNRFSFLTLVLIFLGGSACNVTPDATKSETPAPTKLIKPQPCYAMPPIQDTTKLEQSLRARGIITDEMDEKEAKAKLSEYISNKRKAFNACRKGS